MSAQGSLSRSQRGSSSSNRDALRSLKLRLTKASDDAKDDMTEKDTATCRRRRSEIWWRWSRAAERSTPKMSELWKLVALRGGTETGSELQSWRHSRRTEARVSEETRREPRRALRRVLQFCRHLRRWPRTRSPKCLRVTKALRCLLRRS